MGGPIIIVYTGSIIWGKTLVNQWLGDNQERTKNMDNKHRFAEPFIRKGTLIHFEGKYLGRLLEDVFNGDPILPSSFLLVDAEGVPLPEPKAGDPISADLLRWIQTQEHKNVNPSETS